VTGNCANFGLVISQVLVPLASFAAQFELSILVDGVWVYLGEDKGEDVGKEFSYPRFLQFST
jgi:hypothetical protein